MKLGYVILYVPDVEAAIGFYEKAFRLSRRFVHNSKQYGEMDTGGTVLAFASEELIAATCHGFQPNRLADKPAGAEVAFIADDVAVAFTHAIAAGAIAYVEPITKPWGQIVSYVRDINGFLIEICSEVT